MPLHRQAAGIASSLLIALALAAPVTAAAPTAAGVRHHPVLITAVTGDVDVSMANVDVEPHVGDEVLLPARIVTGRDGTLGLAQSRTSISIAPDSEIEIPEAAYDGHLIGRLVQWRGNVFYDVETREVERLRIETPYLVAVVKGTQFNVAVLDDTTTISLFEGRLEIRDPEGLNVIDLEPGEVAIRSRNDTTIRVIDTNVAELPTVDANGSLVAARAGRRAGDDAFVGVGDAARSTGVSADLSLDDGPALPVDASLGAEVMLHDPALLANADGHGIEMTLGSIAVDGGAAADFGGAAFGAGLDAALDLGDAVADLGLDAAADLGGASLGANLDAGLDLGSAAADLGLDATADLGGASLGANLDAALDLGAGSLGLGLGADAGLADLGIGLDAGDVGLGLGLDTNLVASLDDGGLTGSLDAGLDLGGSGLDAGLDAGLDLTGGEAAADLDLAGLVDAGVDAGLDLSGPMQASARTSRCPAASMHRSTSGSAAATEAAVCSTSSTSISTSAAAACSAVCSDPRVARPPCAQCAAERGARPRRRVRAARGRRARPARAHRDGGAHPRARPRGRVGHRRRRDRLEEPRDAGRMALAAPAPCEASAASRSRGAEQRLPRRRSERAHDARR